MNDLLLFLFLRIADNLTTYLTMAKYGAWEIIEANPVNAHLIGQLGFPLFPIVNVALSMVAFMVLIRLKRVVLLTFMALMSVVVAINTFTLIFI